jgi:hypothetical protein
MSFFSEEDQAMLDEEQRKALEELNDIRQLLSHADCHTLSRMDLARTLRTKAEQLELDFQNDRVRRRLFKGVS